MLTVHPSHYTDHEARPAAVHARHIRVQPTPSWNPRAALRLVATPQALAPADDPTSLACVRTFAHRHGLTGAETRVLAYLVAGSCPKRIASTLGLSIHTIRAQVRAVLEKANLHSLPALVSAVLLPYVWDRQRESQAGAAGA